MQGGCAVLTDTADLHGPEMHDDRNGALNSFAQARQRKPAIPTRSLKQGFKYEPSWDTDIRRLFQRVRDGYEAAP